MRGGDAGGRLGWDGMGFDWEGRCGVEKGLRWWERWVAVYDGMSL